MTRKVYKCALTLPQIKALIEAAEFRLAGDWDDGDVNERSLRAASEALKRRRDRVEPWKSWEER